MQKKSWCPLRAAHDLAASLRAAAVRGGRPVPSPSSRQLRHGVAAVGCRPHTLLHSCTSWGKAHSSRAEKMSPVPAGFPPLSREVVRNGAGGSTPCTLR